MGVPTPLPPGLNPETLAVLCRMPDSELQKLNLPVPLMTAIRVWRVQQSNNVRGRKVGREEGEGEGERRGEGASKQGREGWRGEGEGRRERGERGVEGGRKGEMWKVGGREGGREVEREEGR